MKLIVKGDDLGWTDGVNAGIEKAARDGILTATGAMVNMEAAGRGISLLQKYPHVAIGQHTNVVNGRPCADPSLIPHMVGADGVFHSSSYYRSMMKDVTSREKDVLPYYDEAVTEIRAQVNRFIGLAGRKPDYLEGHSIPSPTFERALKDVAAEEDLVYIDLNARGTEDPVYGVYSPLGIGSAAMSVFSSSDPFAQFSADVVSVILSDELGILGHETAILLFHPGFVDADLFRQSSFTGIRMRDCDALCDPRVKQWVRDNGIELISHRDLKKRQP